ncbi:MAG TPA: TetR/AcrR family transcriptional regulator [Acidimicrobiales bacterium]|nr:TetR/AcrR family transcriptional regulator [Acidimicrobiales bacterium]
MTVVSPTRAAGGDRREARRLARRAALIDAAMGIVARDGIPGLTMQGVADQVGCSIGTVYTHFPSKGVLVADLQDHSVRRIARSFEAVRDRSATVMAAAGWDATERAAADLVLFGEFVVACWDTLPEESHMLFSVLAERTVVVPADELDRVLGPTLVLLAMGREAVEVAATTGAVDDGPPMDRVLIGAAALLGVLLTSHVAHIDAEAFDHHRLARTAWRDMLRGWGMAGAAYDAALAHVRDLAATGPLAPLLPDQG